MITFDDFKANTKEWLIGKLADMSLKEALQTISDLYDELHKPKYPKTYDECRKILKEQADVTYGYKKDVLHSFQKLLICRDAYWKIAGEKMGLGKPWEPKFGKTVLFDISFYLYQDSFVLHKGEYSSSDNCLLVFPTEEMRDAFYENFKDLIEQCKELL